MMRQKSRLKTRDEIRAWIVILFVIVISLAVPMHVQADVGPKPSVIVDFERLDGEFYFATLLSSVESTGPYSAGNTYQEYMGSHEVFLKFVEYEDSDAYNFLCFYQDCSKTNQFSWTYRPPQKFKILLYFPETDTFIVSNEIYERYAFDSYFTAEIVLHGSNLTAEADIVLSRSYNFQNEIISLIIRILLTIAVEIGIALLFGLRGNTVFRFIVLTNIVTQIALNLTLNLISFYMGTLAFVAFYILLEIAVFIIETILYLVLLKSQASKQRLILYSLSSNIFSFALGVVLALWIPSIF